MGLLDVPRGLISRLPLIGGSNDSSDNSEEKTPEPVAEAPEEDQPDEPDTAEHPVEDEPDEPEAEDESEEDEPDSDEPVADTSDEDGKPADDTSDGEENISDTTAPSIGPNTVIEKDSAEERLARHEQSDTDAMGLDKRREVIGGNYNASFGKQVLRYLAVVIVVAAAAFGLRALVSNLDEPPAHPADKAPWSGSDKAPAPLE